MRKSSELMRLWKEAIELQEQANVAVSRARMQQRTEQDAARVECLRTSHTWRGMFCVACDEWRPFDEKAVER